eukprot:TRINITY_DN17749_c0_g1_i1.p1 TRINITY_DN17749_c0_g1~~TRINITY_DN17749_c0_g1_i1.p1  ORF type:complete len:161 (-),score=38.78 TRINITY_DN17749_c0_g1_i1:51-533(-)
MMIAALRALTAPNRCSKLLKVAKTLDQRLHFSCASVMFDHYKTLGVSREASEDEIEKAYFNLAADHYHNPSSRELRKVMEAYETLTDEDAKKVYDAKDYVDEIIKDVAVEETHQSQRRSEEGKMNQTDLAYWMATLCLSVFLIITVPKVLYILFIYLLTP